jgi:hypothetical protein
MTANIQMRLKLATGRARHHHRNSRVVEGVGEDMPAANSALSGEPLIAVTSVCFLWTLKKQHFAAWRTPAAPVMSSTMYVALPAGFARR